MALGQAIAILVACAVAWTEVSPTPVHVDAGELVASAEAEPTTTGSISIGLRGTFPFFRRTFPHFH